MQNDRAVEGLAELEKALLELPIKIGAKVMRGALKKGMEPVLNDVISAAEHHKDTGDLAESFAISTSATKKSGYKMAAKVGNSRKRTPKKEGGRELGSTSQKLIALEYGNKHQAATPFMVQSLESNVNKVIGIVKTELAKGIEKATK